MQVVSIKDEATKDSRSHFCSRHFPSRTDCSSSCLRSLSCVGWLCFCLRACYHDPDRWFFSLVVLTHWVPCFSNLSCANFVIDMKHDGHMVQKNNKGFVSGQDTYTRLLSSMGRRNGSAAFARHQKKCRTCDERIPSWLLRFHKQASEE